MKLALQTLRTAVIGIVVLGALLFIPAGTLAYWPGWAFIVVFSVLTNLIGIYLAIKDPALLARRVKVGPAAETRPLQRLIIATSFAGLIAAAAVSALDWRLGWSQAPLWVMAAGELLVALGLWITFVVLQQNQFAASTVHKMEGQQVISTGLYGIVRHPMYTGTLIMSAGVPLALGSYWGLLVVLIVIPVLVLRIGDEEQMLLSDLAGYAAYRGRVRFRLVPGVW
jgi:protein-S-isoprenylcysteine O-methyltransferase Ste14